jgi:hypothetical protein
MRTDTLRLADLENAVGRFPILEVNEYVNKGLAHVYAEMVTVFDRPHFSSEARFTAIAPSAPGVVPTYPLPLDFLQILSVGWGTGPSGPFIPLEPYEEAERIRLSNANYMGALGELKYGITGGPTAVTQGTIPEAYSLDILGNPSLGSTIILRYIPTCPRLVNDTDCFDGLLGFEDAACTWAAILMRRKDDLDTASLEGDMVKHFSRIHQIAKRRDRSRPPMMSLTRHHGIRGGRWGRGGGGWGGF